MSWKTEDADKIVKHFKHTEQGYLKEVSILNDEVERWKKALVKDQE